MPAAPKPRVLVTRAPNGGSLLAERLSAEGCDPVLIPAIELVPPSSFATLDAALATLDSFAWLLFTSANAVEVFASRWKGTPVPRLAAIGAATARALEQIGLRADLVPLQAVAESLADALLPYARQAGGAPTRFLLIRAEEARELLPETLRAAGAEVTVAPAYRTVIPESSVELIRHIFRPPLGSTEAPIAPQTATSTATRSHLPSILSAAAPSPSPFVISTEARSAQWRDSQLRLATAAELPEPQGSSEVRHIPIQAITFTSASTARNLLALCVAAGVTLPETALRISIGPITTRTLIDLGFPPHAEAREATVAALAKATVEALWKTS